MPCEKVDLGGGNFAIVCGRRSGREKRCKWCEKVATKLCDFPLRGEKAGKTCDAPMCKDCATKWGIDKDLCPPHARLVEKELEEAVNE